MLPPAHPSLRTILAIATGALAATALLPVTAQERIALRGTSVTLTPPPGFVLGRDGKGLENAATGSTITIAERPAQGYADLAARFASAKSLTEGYASQGVTIRAVRQIAVGDGQVPFAIGRQTPKGQGTELTKYLALLRGDKTVLVTFTIGDRSLSEADAEALIRSIELTPEPTVEELLATLPFTFRAAPPFRVTDVRARSSATLSAAPAAAGAAAEPVIVIGRGNSGAALGEEPQVAIDLLQNTSGLRDAVITSAEPAPFAGGTGFVVHASVGQRTIVQYLRIVPGGAYVRFLARGETAAMQDAAAAIAEVASSVELP